MALSPLLSEKGLARFRTKRCERLLASGHCGFGDKCQYSHDSEWLRRNPIKVPYAPDLCPLVAKSGISGCARGSECSLAHSSEEVLYHPRRYKRVSCTGPPDCRGYYCPFAHSQEELKQSARFASSAVASNQDNLHPPPLSAAAAAAASGGQCQGQVPSVGLPSVSTAQQNGSGGSGPAGSQEPGPSPRWCKVDDLLWIDNNAMSASGVPEREPGHDLHSSEALLGPRTVSGLLAVRGDDMRRQPCRFHLFSTSRIDREEAAHVMRDLKRWVALPPLPSAPQNQAPRALVLRRTVATIYLALPDEYPKTLGQCKPCLAQGADLPKVLLPLASSWLRPLAEELQQLHRADIAHLCLSPGTVLCAESSCSSLGEESGSGKSELRLLLGDFLGKIRSLVFLSRGAAKASKDKMWDGRDPAYDAWCAWQPPEVQARIVQLDSTAPSGTSKQRSAPEPVEIDLYKVDSWQLGVVMFFLLTGQHPFGIHEAPLEVRRNISARLPVNLPSLESISRHFFDLVGKLLAHRPEDRPCLDDVLEHPALWTSGRVAQYASESLIQPGLLSAPFGITADDLLKVPALQALRTFEQRSEQTTDATGIDAQPGSFLQCIWNEALQYRHSPNGSDKAGETIASGDEVVVLERSHDWIRTSVGWLPLFGIENAQRQLLFKAVKPKERRTVSLQKTPADPRIVTPKKPGLLSKSNQNTPVKVSPRLSVLLPTTEQSRVKPGFAGVRPIVHPAHTDRRKATSAPAVDEHRHQRRHVQPQSSTAACHEGTATPTVLRPPGLFPQSTPIATHHMPPAPDPISLHQLSSHQSMQPPLASAWSPGTQSYGGVQMQEQDHTLTEATQFADVTGPLRSPAPVLPPGVAPPPGLPGPAPVPSAAAGAVLEHQAACGDLRSFSFDASMRHDSLLQGTGIGVPYEGSYASHAAEVWDAYFAAGFQAAFQELTTSIHSYPPCAPDWQRWQQWQQAQLENSALKLPAVLPAVLPSVLATEPYSSIATAASPPESPTVSPARELVRMSSLGTQSSGHDAGQSASSTDAYVPAWSVLDLVDGAESVPAVVPLPAAVAAASISAELDCAENEEEEEPVGREGSLFWSLPSNTLNGQPPTPPRHRVEI